MGGYDIHGGSSVLSTRLGCFGNSEQNEETDQWRLTFHSSAGRTCRRRMAISHPQHTMPITGNFDEAVGGLVDFLRAEKQPSNLIWITREEITGHKRSIFVHPSPSRSNRDFYRAWFLRGVARGRSTTFEATCFARDQAYCYVRVSPVALNPSNPRGTGHLNFNFALLSHEPSQGMSATRSLSVFAFRLRRAMCRLRGEPFYIKEVPSRSELQDCADNIPNV